MCELQCKYIVDVTQRTQLSCKIIVILQVMDTVGFLDNREKMTVSKVTMNLAAATISLGDGPHVIIYAIKFGRYVAADFAVFNLLQRLCPGMIFDRFLIIAPSQIL